MLAQIVAISENCGIGRENRMLCHISEDLRYFKRVTLGHTLIMGRNTFQSLPGVLPGRGHIVLTRGALSAAPGVTVSNDLGGLIKTYQNAPETAFVIGGADVYAQTLPYCAKLYVTKIHALFAADAFYPYDFEDGFNIEYKSDIMTDEKSGISFEFVIYTR